jgi:hypothetical protein
MQETSMSQKVLSVSQVELSVLESNPPILVVRVTGEVPTPGWTQFALARRVPIVPPADGIYEADAYGEPPSGAEPEVVTAFTFADQWKDFPSDLKGVRIWSATNDVTSALA